MTPEQIIEITNQAMTDACVNFGEEPPPQEELDSTHGDLASQWFFQRFAQLVRNAALEEAAKVCDLQHDRARTSAAAARADSCSIRIRSLKS